MELNDIRIRQAIVHILDTNIDMPILSDNLLETNEEINEFIKSHIYKILTGDDFKLCEFISPESYIAANILVYTEEDFVVLSKNIASYIYEFIKQHVDIPSADLLVSQFELNGDRYIAVLKMNYKSSYIHFVETENNETNNTIIKQKTVLPSMGQKLNEAIIINLEDNSIRLIEKKYEINGNKEYYMSKYIVECRWDFSSKAKLNMITKTVNDINRKYFDDDVEKQMEFKKTLYQEYEDKGTIEVETVANKVFEDNTEIKEEFKEKMDKYGIIDSPPVTFQAKTSTKKFEKQVIKTDTGIEINVPIEQYKEGDLLEFITNPDGTISILIKNITKLSGR